MKRKKKKQFEFSPVFAESIDLPKSTEGQRLLTYILTETFFPWSPDPAIWRCILGCAINYVITAVTFGVGRGDFQWRCISVVATIHIHGAARLQRALITGTIVARIGWGRNKNRRSNVLPSEAPFPPRNSNSNYPTDQGEISAQHFSRRCSVVN